MRRSMTWYLYKFNITMYYPFIDNGNILPNFAEYVQLEGGNRNFVITRLVVFAENEESSQEQLHILF